MTQTPEDVLNFWFEETPSKLHFMRDDGFDQKIATRFCTLYQLAITAKLDDWVESAEGALALVILLDQFSRNLHRGNAAAFDHDDMAVAVASAAIEKGFDLKLPKTRRAFLYMPYMHAEDLHLQQKSVALFSTNLPGSYNIKHAEQHRDINEQFARFPHRNRVLNRQSTKAEEAYLEDGGFNP